MNAGCSLKLFGVNEIERQFELHYVLHVRCNKGVFSGAALVDAPCTMAMLHIETVVLTLHVPVVNDLVVGRLHVIQLKLAALDLISEPSSRSQHHLFRHPGGTCRLLRLVVIVIVIFIVKVSIVTLVWLTLTLVTGASFEDLSESFHAFVKRINLFAPLHVPLII